VTWHRTKHIPSSRMPLPSFRRDHTPTPEYAHQNELRIVLRDVGKERRLFRYREGKHPQRGDGNGEADGADRRVPCNVSDAAGEGIENFLLVGGSEIPSTLPLSVWTPVKYSR